MVVLLLLQGRHMMARERTWRRLMKLYEEMREKRVLFRATHLKKTLKPNMVNMMAR